MVESNLSFRLESAIPLVQRELESFPDRDKVAFAFPDDGAYKRFHRHFPEDLTIICAKVRDGAARIVTVKDGECWFVRRFHLTHCHSACLSCRPACLHTYTHGPLVLFFFLHLTAMYSCTFRKA